MGVSECIVGGADLLDGLVHRQNLARAFHVRGRLAVWSGSRVAQPRTVRQMAAMLLGSLVGLGVGLTSYTLKITMMCLAY
jgi:hypothetical protein